MNAVRRNGRPGGSLEDMPDTELEEVAEESAAPVPEVSFTGIDLDRDGEEGESKTGAQVIQALVKRLPNAPGVYRMMNAAGDVLYVGKARSLKKRVTQYAQGRFHTN